MALKENLRLKQLFGFASILKFGERLGYIIKGKMGMEKMGNRKNQVEKVRFLKGLL